MVLRLEKGFKYKSLDPKWSQHFLARDPRVTREIGPAARKSFRIDVYHVRPLNGSHWGNMREQ